MKIFGMDIPEEEILFDAIILTVVFYGLMDMIISMNMF